MASASAALEQRNQDATCYVGGLDDGVDDELLWELFVQAGPVVSVHMPKDKVSGRHQNYAFVEYRSEVDAEYAIKVLNMTRLFGKLIRVTKASADKGSIVDIGANLFIGNLDASVDEKMLYDTFSAFGGIVSQPKMMRDPVTGESRGFGFVSYDAFEAADLAIECMNGQFFAGRQIVVQYAYRKDSRTERHGSHAERMAAAAMIKRPAIRPNLLFATAPGQMSSNVPATGGAPMLGQAAAPAPPPMLPPTAILPASLMPPPLPSAALSGMPPPLPAGAAAYPPPSHGGGMLPPPLPAGVAAFGRPPPFPAPGGMPMYGGGMPPPLPQPGMMYGMPPPLPGHMQTPMMGWPSGGGILPPPLPHQAYS